jgi:hypothetical protein
MKKQLIAVSLLSALSINASAQELSISITNLMQGVHFTPLIVSAHNAQASMFTVATPASSQIQDMAEGGSIVGLSEVMTAAGADIVANPAGGLLGPSVNTELAISTTEGNTHLSLSAMLLQTNDGFVGLDSWMIPAEAGTYTVFLNAYDAGTEANDELVTADGAITGMPGMPPMPEPAPGTRGVNGTGVSDAQSNTNVHIHRGSMGDDDLTGGKSDLDNRVHRWLNPVAKLTVTVQ